MKRKTLGEVSRNYRFSMEEGSSQLARTNTIAAQARKYRWAMSRNLLVCRRVRELLRNYTVDPTVTFGYVAFALRLDRLARKYTKATLSMEAEIELATWVGRGLSQKVLEAIQLDMLGPEVDNSSGS